MSNTIQDSDKIFRELTTPRFLNYVRFRTTSERHNPETPSTPGQWDLAKALVGELKGLGINDVTLTDHCYVIARLPASPGMEGRTAIGFLAHMDTSEEVSGDDVKAIVEENYDGKLISMKDGFVLDPAADPALAAQKGKTIIHTDGATLLGADNKA